MSSSCVSYVAEDVPVQTLFQNVLSSSSEEPPMEEWSSLFIVETPPENPKMVLYKEGLYDPGSAEICTKYIPMSDSTVLRHPYYAYPGIKDPGILGALQGPEDKKIYACDGQQLYLDLCKEMDVIPVRSFHQALHDELIDLRVCIFKYYGVNPVGVRAMCMALSYNGYVRRLDLTSNFLSEDACYHLGQLLGENFVLQELILSGCKIRGEEMRRLTVNLSSRSMDFLDLSKNGLGDNGFQYLANQILKGAVIKRLNLSHNSLGTESALALAAAIVGNNTVTHLDLGWNNLYSPKGVNELLRQLSESKVLVELNLSWNALTTGIVLRRILSIPTLCFLDLSNNRLSNPAAKAIALKLPIATKLRTLDLSYNPLTPTDALMIVSALKTESVKLRNLLMKNVIVTKEFMEELEEVLALKYRSNMKITHGNVIRDYALTVPDMREIIMRRLEFLTSRATKRCDLDIVLYFLKTRKECSFIQPRQFLRDMKLASAPIDEGLIDELANIFPGPRTDKGGKTINLDGVIEFLHRLWPERKLPPTPPPPPPPPEPKRKKKRKGKKKM